jgi:ABC-2 type transport system permease protein
VRRYWTLWKSFFRASVLADTEYRLNIVLRILGESVWYVAQLSLFEVLYLHTHSINGWSAQATRVFQGTLFLVDNLYMVLFAENLDQLNGIVRRGDLDLYLTKPVNAQFMLSLRRVSVAYLPNTLILTGYVTWAIRGLPQHIGAGALALYAGVALCGLISYYAMRFLFGTAVIVLQDAGNVQFLWHNFFRLGTRPDSVYPKSVRWLILTLVPVAFIASVPARALLDQPTPALVWFAPVLSVSLVWISSRTWTWALRHYASASS